MIDDMLTVLIKSNINCSGINMNFVYNDISPEGKVSILIERIYNELPNFKDSNMLLQHCGKYINRDDIISKVTIPHDNLITLNLVSR